jgi:hypothetical protein
VFGGLEMSNANGNAPQAWLPWIASPLPVAGAVLGVASVLANAVWNCNTCGWDFDGVPWYQALLVVGVPFLIAPLGTTLLGLRTLLLRNRGAAIVWGATTVGLALPWIYFLVRYFVDRSENGGQWP